MIALLERDTGATLAELIAATSWLPHTTRAALTGLRKKGHAIERSKRGEERFDELNGRCIQCSRDFKQGDDCGIAATIFQSADVLLTEA